MQPQTGAEAVRWNLEDLFATPDALHAALADAQIRAQAFHAAHAGAVAALAGDALRQALETYAALQDVMGRAYTYAYLLWSEQTTDPERGRLLQSVREAHAQFAQQLVFFDLEWAQIPPEEADND